MELRFNNEEREVLDFIKQIAQATGTNFYLVGGFVRDKVLGQLSYDIDVCHDGSFDDIVHEITANMGLTLLARFPKYLSFSMKRGNYSLDFVSFRKERYTQSSHLPNVMKGNFISDVMRRDFTINSIYYSVLKDKVIDPLGGALDIQMKRIVPNTPMTLSEDPSRIFRMVHYAHRLGFSFSSDLIASNVGAISQKMKAKNIVFELIKLLKKEGDLQFVKTLAEYRVLDAVGISEVNDGNGSMCFEEKLRALCLSNPEFRELLINLKLYVNIIRDIQ